MPGFAKLGVDYTAQFLYIPLIELVPWIISLFRHPLQAPANAQATEAKPTENDFEYVKLISNGAYG